MRGQISVALKEKTETDFTFFIRLPIFVDRKLQQYFTTTECYKNMPDDVFNIPEDVKGIFTKAESEALEEHTDAIEGVYNSYMNSLYSLKNAEKDKLITNEEFLRAREILCGQLPTSAMTEITVSLTQDEISLFSERCKNETKEIQEIAKSILEIVKC